MIHSKKLSHIFNPNSIHTWSKQKETKPLFLEHKIIWGWLFCYICFKCHVQYVKKNNNSEMIQSLNWNFSYDLRGWQRFPLILFYFSFCHIIFLSFIFETVSLCKSGWPRTHYVAGLASNCQFPASAFWVSGSWACTIRSNFILFYLWHKIPSQYIKRKSKLWRNMHSTVLLV